MGAVSWSATHKHFLRLPRDGTSDRDLAPLHHGAWPYRLGEGRNDSSWSRLISTWLGLA
jgi:hypothetical protein